MDMPKHKKGSGTMGVDAYAWVSARGALRDDADAGANAAASAALETKPFASHEPAEGIKACKPNSAEVQRLRHTSLSAVLSFVWSSEAVKPGYAAAHQRGIRGGAARLQ